MSKTWRKLLWVALLLPMLLLSAQASARRSTNTGLRNVTILIVRHAEKQADGNGLSAQGLQRAAAYARYFDPFKYNGQDLVPTRLIATADTDKSMRPRLTLEPLAKQLGLKIEQPWGDDDVDELNSSLRRFNRAKVVVIAWHHGRIGELIDLLGGDRRGLLGQKSWPDNVYDWVIVLHYNDKGVLDRDARVTERLLPGDGG